MNASTGCKYIEITEETWLLLNKSGIRDERKAMPGKIYRVYDEDSSFYKIRFGSKYGFVTKEHAKAVNNASHQKIMIAWDSIQSKDKNKEHYNKYINKNCMEQGLDVISPTWFTRVGDAKNIDNINVMEKCDREYVRIAHNHGYEVWGLIADFNADRNYAVYTNESLVNKEIDEIVKYALEYDLDGINIDFEGFGSKCKKVFNSYVKKLSEELKRYNFIVSIDITRESDSDAWGKCYDRKELSKYMDYICFMAYDENGRLDIVPGSTASLPWVEEGISELLNMGIPKEKLILGIPFYSRDWRVTKIKPKSKSVVVVEWEGIFAYLQPKDTSEKIAINAGDVLDYLGESGDYYKVMVCMQECYIKKAICRLLNPNEEMYKTVEVVPINMKEMKNKKDGAVLVFDDYSKQNKIMYKDETGDVHFIWVEDEASVKMRLDLVKKYTLPGAAAWMLTHETYETWKVIKNLKQ
jgi:spore germination protein YaaH